MKDFYKELENPINQITDLQMKKNGDMLQKPMNFTTADRFKLTTCGRFKLTTCDRGKLTTC